MTEYHLPPEGYEPPTKCDKCGERIIYAPVIGGTKWVHLVSPYWHDAEVGRWFDIASGVWREGNQLVPSRDAMPDGET